MKRFEGYRFLGILILLKAVCVFLTGCGAQEKTENRTADPAKGRMVLTVATDWAGADFTARVNAFNESSEEYYVEIRQYEAEGISDDPIEAFAIQLTMDILSGKGPDMVCLGASSYSPSIASEKLMENLYSYMEADEEFHREDYYENILKAFELNGGLYVLPAGFGIDTMCGKAEELEPRRDVGNREISEGAGTERKVTENWIISEMIAAYENSPHAECLTLNDSNWLTFQEVCGGCIGNFVNWEMGECRFDTPEFVELLEFSDSFSGELILANESDFSFSGALQSGKALLQPVILRTPWDVASWRVTFGDAELLWPGYPVADEDRVTSGKSKESAEEMGGGVAKPYGSCLSICANSSHKEAAWEFVKSFLTPEAQREITGIPLLKSVSEERIQEALTPEYETVDGVKKEKIRHEILIEGDDIPGLAAITEEDAEVFRSIITGTHRSTGYAPGMFNIIREEVSAYYEKDKDAVVVAGIIQNRVSVFVSERRN